MKTYSFRAECKLDVERFQMRFRASFPHVLQVRMMPLRLVNTTVAQDVSEVAVEVKTPLGVDYVRAVMQEVVDGHVMLQTLRELPLNENSLERDSSIE
jgi:hypothetical protein